MTTAHDSADARPRTAVLHQFVGIGDLVWHVPYLRCVAASSFEGRVSVIASPTTFASELLGHESWVREVIEFDRWLRRGERRQARHRGVMGFVRMGIELRPMGFERIVLFSHHANRAVVACIAGIPQRIGYGTSWLQRRLLSKTPWIDRYAGPAVPPYKDATAFAISQGWCGGPIVPRLAVRPDALVRVRQRLSGLARPLHALSIGSSEPAKQWGEINFAALARGLSVQGHGVVIVGGPGEAALGQAVLRRVDEGCRGRVTVMCDGTVSESVAAMSLASTCTGNDTGATNIAAAVGTPTLVLLGARPSLEHDPDTMTMVRASCLAAITPAEILGRVLEQAVGLRARSD